MVHTLTPTLEMPCQRLPHTEPDHGERPGRRARVAQQANGFK
jgi:hypothetical protein